MSIDAKSAQKPKRSILDASSLFMITLPHWRSMISFLGLWLLICPPVGWLMALGYRKQILLFFFHPSVDDLRLHRPSLRTALILAREGICALGVIVFYFLPTLSLIWTWGMHMPVEMYSVHSIFTFKFLEFVSRCFMITPLSLGGCLLYYQFYIPEFTLSIPHGALALFLLGITLFMIPLAFMQIAKRGLWRDAFRLDQVTLLFARIYPNYIGAWQDSLLMTFSAFTLGPRIPWGIAWSYMGIVWRFNWIQCAVQTQCALSTEFSIPSSVSIIHTRFTSVPMWWTAPK